MDRYRDLARLRRCEGRLCLPTSRAGDVAVLEPRRPRVWSSGERRLRSTVLSLRSRSRSTRGPSSTATTRWCGAPDARSATALRDGATAAARTTARTCWRRWPPRSRCGRRVGRDRQRRCAPRSGCRTGSSWSASRRGARYFDDSKATNIGAVEKSIASFREPDRSAARRLRQGRRLRRAAAGADRATVRRVVCFGAAGPHIARQLAGQVAV